MDLFEDDLVRVDELIGVVNKKVEGLKFGKVEVILVLKEMDSWN